MNFIVTNKTSMSRATAGGGNVLGKGGIKTSSSTRTWYSRLCVFPYVGLLIAETRAPCSRGSGSSLD